MSDHQFFPQSSPRSADMQVVIPRFHYVHLKKLADCRQEEVGDAAAFILQRGLRHPSNWIDDRYNSQPGETRTIKLPDRVEGSAESLCMAIQALPRVIKPRTDRLRSESVSFFKSDDGVQGIDLDGRRFLDRSPATDRDKAMLRLMEDRLPKMGASEYRILNFAQSQYKILMLEPESYGMPRRGEVAVDAGSFVGYKAIAMADWVGPGGKVLSIELDAANCDLQRRNIDANGLKSTVNLLQAALAPVEGEMEVLSRVAGTMGHSLTDFEGFGSQDKKMIPTRRLDNVFREAGLDYIDSLHISVNGFEREVLDGLGDYVHRVGVFRVTAPYVVNGVNVAQRVADYFREHNIRVWGKSQAAVLAGKEGGRFPVQPLS